MDKILADKKKTGGFFLALLGLAVGSVCFTASFWQYRMWTTYEAIEARLGQGLQFTCQVYSPHSTLPTHLASMYSPVSCSSLSQCKCNEGDDDGNIWKNSQCEPPGFENVQKDLFQRDHGLRTESLVQLPCSSTQHSDLPALVEILPHADGTTITWAGRFEGCTIVKWFKGEEEDSDWKGLSNKYIAKRGNVKVPVGNWMGWGYSAEKEEALECVALPASSDWTSDELMVNVNLSQAKKSAKHIKELLEWKFIVAAIGAGVGFLILVVGCVIFITAQKEGLVSTQFVVTWGDEGPNADIDPFFRIDMRAVAAETLAMFLFVIIGCGSACGHGASDPAQRLVVAFAFGIGIVVLAYTFAHHSGAQINCAVTFSLVLGGLLPVVQGAANFFGQMFGSVCGAIVLYIMFPCEEDATKSFGSNGYEHEKMGEAFAGEVMGTFILCYVVWEVAVNPASGTGAKNNAALAIGLAVFIIHIVLLPLTGCSINPTRSFGPWFVAMFRACTPYNSYLSDFWLFWFAPLLGAAIAAATKYAFFPKDSTSEGKKLIATSNGDFIFVDSIPDKPKRSGPKPQPVDEQGNAIQMDGEYAKLKE